MKSIREISDGLNAVVKAIGVGKLSTMYESPRIQELAAALSEHVNDELRAVTGVALHTIERGDRIRILDNIAHMIPEGFDDLADAIANEKWDLVRHITEFGDARRVPPHASGAAQCEKPAAPTAAEALAEQDRQDAMKPEHTAGIALRDLPNLGQPGPANDAPGGADEADLDRTAEFGATGGE